MNGCLSVFRVRGFFFCVSQNVNAVVLPVLLGFILLRWLGVGDAEVRGFNSGCISRQTALVLADLGYLG
ncbi:hypothetical protein P170DRAFT_438064 [Aspergillus steynii IBT 23096]|uniref:Uncharacterized protein n=1 Tax=Aspergillus steynii IBT 23096 TaxID=1392250 RepID=A0A2I2G6C7_9EURO|nr:uncharacterized protein P170DRAFT_438064 [Aspergillus steynii IBT 23096]PLB48430.1 hypothetical protein P170DRAFT_438064 [Aspergillus steynii IBT 23096]